MHTTLIEFYTDESGTIAQPSTFTSRLSRFIAQAEVIPDSSHPGPDVLVDVDVDVDIDITKHYLDRLYALADMIRPLSSEIEETEARIEVELKDLWEDNPDIRKRGLRGGNARKEKRLGKKFVPIRKMTPQHNMRRVEVERLDYLGRNRIAGLRVLRDILTENFAFVRSQQHQCQVILTHAAILNQGISTPMEPRLTMMANEVFSEEHLDKIEDIEEMLETFHEQYCL